MALPDGLSITWFGHSTFLVQLPNGKRILFDPFILGNPSCPTEMQDLAKIGSVDLLLITHGHLDHFADVIPIAKATDCTVVCIFEIMEYLNEQGLQKFEPMNKGGSITLSDFGVTITMTEALHSSRIKTKEGDIYAGEPAGFVVTLEDGFAFYFAGDTALFSDMKLIAELYQPKLAFLPIGDRFTMGPREAAKSLTFLNTVETAVPMHFGTFSLLSGTPEAFAIQLEKEGSTVSLLTLTPGETRSF